MRRGNSPRICKGVKFLQQEKKSKENEQEAYQGQLVGSRKKVDEMFNQTLKRVYNTFYQAVDQLEALRPGVQIIRSQLNPHKVVWDWALVDEDNTQFQNGDSWIYFCFLLICMGFMPWCLSVTCMNNIIYLFTFFVWYILYVHCSLFNILHGHHSILVGSFSTLSLSF